MGHYIRQCQDRARRSTSGTIRRLLEPLAEGRWWRVVGAGAIALLLIEGTLLAGRIAPEVLNRATQAVVLIRVQRVYMGTHLPTSGTGFFVHSDGYILTNWHVIAEQIQAPIFGRWREANTTIVDIEVVVNSGMPDEITLPTKVVSRDRDSDLALLKVSHNPESFISLEKLGTPELTQQMWFVGFPFGDALTVERTVEGASPEASVSIGHVSSLRHDDNGALRTLQTDAALNPGNSGGPALDENGRLLGVARARISGADGVGFIIAPAVLRQFTVRNGVRLRFKPTVVYFPPQPIVVTAEPLLVNLDGARLTARLEGTDVPTVETPFAPAADGAYQATLDVPEPIANAQPAESYSVTVTSHGTTADASFARRFRLDPVRLGEVATLESDRDPTAMMADRKILADDASLSDYAASQSGKQQLGDIAGNVSLRKDANSSVTIDNRSLEKNRSELRGKPEWYEHLTRPELRENARRFDELVPEMVSLRSASESYRRGQWDYEAYREVTDKLRTVQRELHHLERYLEQQNVCRCYGTVWYYCSRAPCADPMTVDEIISESN